MVGLPFITCICIDHSSIMCYIPNIEIATVFIFQLVQVLQNMKPNDTNYTKRLANHTFDNLIIAKRKWLLSP